MKAAHANAGLIVASAAGLAVGVRILAAPLVVVAALPVAALRSSVEASPPPVDVDSLAARLVAHDPFRVTRRPSSIVYDPVRLAQPTTPPLPKPVLTLVGIVWDRGRDPTALVEGLPGAEGPHPMRLGEAIGGLRAKNIKPDRVVITGFDTTWTLMMREPWK
jgi:hypothetical protein